MRNLALVEGAKQALASGLFFCSFALRHANRGGCKENDKRLERNPKQTEKQQSLGHRKRPNPTNTPTVEENPKPKPKTENRTKCITFVAKSVLYAEIKQQ